MVSIWYAVAGTGSLSAQIILSPVVAGIGSLSAQIIWNIDVPYRAVEWGLPFPMNAKTLHREHPIIDYQALTPTKCSR